MEAHPGNAGEAEPTMGERGWYRDPDYPTRYRWWNGASWGRVKGRVNRLAVAALAFAWVVPIGGVPAVVLGALAIQEINDFDSSERGKGLATWAIIIGVVNIAIVVVGIVLLLTHGSDSSHNGGFGCAAWEEIEGLC